MPIGGLKEKLLAALRAGVKQVLIPHDNEKDLQDMPDKIIDSLKITPVRWVDEVMEMALAAPLKPLSKKARSKAAKPAKTAPQAPTRH